MHFAVQGRYGGSWHLVGAIEAESAIQAVSRAAPDAGLYRAGPLGTTGLERHFVVPTWGPPEPVEPHLTGRETFPRVMLSPRRADRRPDDEEERRGRGGERFL